MICSRLVISVVVLVSAQCFCEYTRDDDNDSSRLSAPLNLIEELYSRDGSVVGLYTGGVSTSGRDYKRVGPDDDEIHDEEILKAVQRSLYEFYVRKMMGNESSNGRRRVKRGIKMVCYGILGCFRDEGVFDYLDMVPAPPEEIGTRFMVYTRFGDVEVYDWDNYTMIGGRGSRFNASNPSKIIIHGFGSTCNRMWASEMRQALMAVVDCNVICVDWENGAALPNYVRAAVNTRLVGKQVSLFVNWLNSNEGSRNEDFHLIGFSLGAHVAGFAGSELKNLSRITGLDPAGPLFESYDAKVRLDVTDAMFVDIIHSNGDSLLMGGLGSWEAIGHLDFYPNGGRAQKGCSHMFLGAFRDLIWSPSSSSSSLPPPQQSSPLPLTTTLPPPKTLSLSPQPPPPPHHHSKMRMRMLPIVDTLHPPPPPPPPPTTTLPPETDGRSLCNHRRAYKFFTESVSPRCQFPAFFCESFDKYLSGVCFHGIGNRDVVSYNMGYYADVGWEFGRERVSEKGRLLYLATRDEEPFCANQYRIRVESSPSPAPISTYGGLEAVLIGGSEEGGGVVDFVNNTFLVTQTPKDNMIAGSVLQRVVVAHPMLTTPTKINLKYTAYQGWLYSGISRWSMDRIVVIDPRGVSSSFCTRGLLLPSGISVTVTLTPGLCTNHPNPPLAPPPPNYPNYPYETYTHNKQRPESQGPPPLTSLSKLTLRNDSNIEYSDWMPINTSSATDVSTIGPVIESTSVVVPVVHPHVMYVSKHVLPGDIDNLLHEQESNGPGEFMRNVPTRLLLGTTRSLKSRPIVLRGRGREGRGMDGGVYYVPVRVSGGKKKRANEHAMRQVGIKMLENEEIGDVVRMPGERWKRGKGGLVALRRRKKGRKG